MKSSCQPLPYAMYAMYSNELDNFHSMYTKPYRKHENITSIQLRSSYVFLGRLWEYLTLHDSDQLVGLLC